MKDFAWVPAKYNVHVIKSFLQGNLISSSETSDRPQSFIARHYSSVVSLSNVLISENVSASLYFLILMMVCPKFAPICLHLKVTCVCPRPLRPLSLPLSILFGRKNENRIDELSCAHINLLMEKTKHDGFSWKLPKEFCHFLALLSNQ